MQEHYGSGSGACARQGRGVCRRSAPFRSCSSLGFGLLEENRRAVQRFARLCSLSGLDYSGNRTATHQPLTFIWTGLSLFIPNEGGVGNSPSHCPRALVSALPCVRCDGGDKSANQASHMYLLPGMINLHNPTPVVSRGNGRI